MCGAYVCVCVYVCGAYVCVVHVCMCSVFVMCVWYIVCVVHVCNACMYVVCVCVWCLYYYHLHLSGSQQVLLLPWGGAPR